MRSLVTPIRFLISASCFDLYNFYFFKGSNHQLNLPGRRLSLLLAYVLATICFGREMIGLGLPTPSNESLVKCHKQSHIQNTNHTENIRKPVLLELFFWWEKNNYFPAGQIFLEKVSNHQLQVTHELNPTSKPPGQTLITGAALERQAKRRGAYAVF